MHGSRLAARYLASCLKEAGIAPLEKDNYYQPFEAYNKERQQRGRWQVHPDSIAILEQGTHRILQMSNVLGTIPGERPDEYVIVGAPVSYTHLIFAQSGGNGGQSHRAAFELVNDGAEYLICLLYTSHTAQIGVMYLEVGQ